MKNKMLILFALISASVLTGQTANISVTEGGATTYRNLPIDSEALTSGLLMGGKANVDGSNVENAAQWRSNLDVLTSGQIEALLEGYVQTVGGVAPDGDGDVTGIPVSSTVLDGEHIPNTNGLVPIYDYSTRHLLGYHVTSAAASNSTIARRDGVGRLAVGTYPNTDEHVVNRGYLELQAPTLRLAPAQTSVAKRFYPVIDSPEAGQGEKTWVYEEGIPHTALLRAAGGGGWIVPAFLGTSQGSPASALGATANVVAGVHIALTNATGNLLSAEPTDNQHVVTRQYLEAQSPTTRTAPAADTVEKRYRVELVVPAEGDGDPYFEYVETP